MRVLLINYEYPPLGGGAGNATANIAREMVKQGHTVFVMTSCFANLPSEEDIDGYRVLRIPARRAAADRSNPLEMLTFMLSSMLQVILMRRRLAVDYCVAFFGIPSAPAAWVLRMITGVPYAVSLRGGDVPGFQPYDLKTFHRMTRPVIKLLWRSAAQVVANSQGLAELARQTAPHREIKVIPNGIQLDYFVPADALPSNDAFLFVGRLREQKGLHYLIDAVALLSSQEQQKISISVVGDGPWRENFIQRAEAKGVRGQFDFVGWVERTEILTHYQAHCGIILPSLDEGMPNVLLEAMACGLPVIASDIAGNRELVLDNGWLVAKAKPDQLADALREALGDRERLTQMGQASRRIAEGYSWRHVADTYLALMQENAFQ